MNGRLSRQLRHNGLFDPSQPELKRVREQLFGSRFQGGFGLADPAYVPLFPHEAAAYLMSRGEKRWDKMHSAEDLAAFIDQAPAVDQLGAHDESERWYDDSARSAAKLILERLRAVPAEQKLVVTFWETMNSTFPAVAGLHLSTIQRDWIRSAVFRVLDAHRFDGHN